MGRPPSPQFRDPETLVAGNPDESDYDVSAPGSQTASYVTNEPDTSFPSICGVLVTASRATSSRPSRFIDPHRPASSSYATRIQLAWATGSKIASYWLLNVLFRRDGLSDSTQVLSNLGYSSELARYKVNGGFAPCRQVARCDPILSKPGNSCSIETTRLLTQRPIVRLIATILEAPIPGFSQGNT